MIPEAIFNTQTGASGSADGDIAGSTIGSAVNRMSSSQAGQGRAQGHANTERGNCITSQHSLHHLECKHFSTKRNTGAACHTVLLQIFAAPLQQCAAVSVTRPCPCQ